MFELVYWHWILLGFFLIALEMFLSLFMTLWFGIAAVIVGLCLSIFPLSLFWQLTVWLILSLFFCFLWFFWYKPSASRKEAEAATLSMIGESAQVIKVPEGEVSGVLRFHARAGGGDEWQFVCDAPVSFGDTVVVTGQFDEKTLKVKQL